MKTSEILRDLKQEFGRIEVAMTMVEQLLSAENFSGATQVLPNMQSELKGFSEKLNKTWLDAAAKEEEKAQENSHPSEQKDEAPIG